MKQKQYELGRPGWSCWNREEGGREKLFQALCLPVLVEVRGDKTSASFKVEYFSTKDFMRFYLDKQILLDKNEDLLTSLLQRFEKFHRYVDSCNRQNRSAGRFAVFVWSSMCTKI